MIRLATLDDVPEIALLGEAFFREAAWSDIVDYVIEDTEKTLAHLVESEDGLLIVDEEDGEIVGMAGGLCFPFYFNHAHRTGQEMFWYVKPGLRNGTGARLLAALENEARAKGCISWAMISLARVRPEVMRRFYLARGYRESEHIFIKRL